MVFLLLLLLAATSTESVKLDPPKEHAPALSPVMPLVVSRVPSAGKRIALTFDACSTRKPTAYDERITQVLEETKTPATIFVGGRWALEESEHLKRLAANPLFELANHTWDHPHLAKVSEARIRSEIQRAQDAIYAVTGRTPTLFRPPFGEFDVRVSDLAADFGLTSVEFDLPSGDPDKHASKDRLVEWVTRRARPGSIVVMHINTHGWHTAEALPEIIEKLRKKGYELVTVGDLMKAGHIAAAPAPAVELAPAP